MLLNRNRRDPSDRADDEHVAQPWRAAPVGRQGYRPSAGNRWVGLGGTLAIYAVALLVFFYTVTLVAPVQTPSTLTVVNLRPEASPPETPPKEKEAPRSIEEERPSKAEQVRPIELPKAQISPVAMPIPVAVPEPADPTPKDPQTAAPKTMPTSPAPEVANNAPDTWEGRVLAALNRVRRYPRAAIVRRQQGVPYIRFVMDREGKVLSSRLERSSGHQSLDNEAVNLPKRASPLPKPTDDVKGDTIELVVPVEFFL